MASYCLCKPPMALGPASRVKPVTKQTFGRASPGAAREAAPEALPNGALILSKRTFSTFSQSLSFLSSLHIYGLPVKVPCSYLLIGIQHLGAIVENWWDDKLNFFISVGQGGQSLPFCSSLACKAVRLVTDSLDAAFIHRPGLQVPGHKAPQLSPRNSSRPFSLA